MRTPCLITMIAASSGATGEWSLAHPSTPQRLLADECFRLIHLQRPVGFVRHEELLLRLVPGHASQRCQVKAPSSQVRLLHDARQMVRRYLQRALSSALTESFVPLRQLHTSVKSTLCATHDCVCSPEDEGTGKVNVAFSPRVSDISAITPPGVDEHSALTVRKRAEDGEEVAEE